MFYDLGEAIPRTWVLGSAGTVVYTLTAPDGTTTTPAVTGASTYTVTVPATTQAGRYEERWVSTGATQAAQTDVFDVFATDPRFMLSLDEARSALNTPTGVTVNDEELRLYLAAATVVIEDMAGPQLKATATHCFDGGRGTLVLPEIEIAAVNSITVNGATIDPSSYRVDTYSGVIYAYYGQFQWGIRNVVVSYTVGGAAVAPNVVLAARELVRFWWQQGQQGNAGRGRSQPDADVFASSGYAVPRRVIELLAPQMQSAL